MLGKKGRPKKKKFKKLINSKSEEPCQSVDKSFFYEMIESSKLWRK